MPDSPRFVSDAPDRRDTRREGRPVVPAASRRRARRLAFLVPLAAAVAVLPGCPAFTNLVLKPTGIVSPPEFELPESVPQDFELKVHIVDQVDPPADYLLTYRRDGKCDYRVTTRLPKRRVTEGAFEITDTQVDALWKAIREAAYADLPDRTPDEGDGPDKGLGVQAYSVRAMDLSREVRAHFQKVPALEKVRAIAMSYLPPKAVADTGPAPTSVGTSKQIVGDVQTKLFYPADDARLKDVPADRRQPFGSYYDALNYGFSPAPGYRPWEQRQ